MLRAWTATDQLALLEQTVMNKRKEQAAAVFRWQTTRLSRCTHCLRCRYQLASYSDDIDVAMTALQAPVRIPHVTGHGQA